MPDNIVSVDFRRHLPIEKGDLVLDVGCGQGRHTSEICLWDCRIIGTDVNRDDLKVAKYLVSFKLWAHQAVGIGDFAASDAQRLPFKDGVFDKVVCTEVLEHVPDHRAALSELIRVLKPGGLLAVSVPAYIPEALYWRISWDYAHSPGGHVRVFRPGEMERNLLGHGVDVYAQRRRHSVQAFYYLIRCTFGLRNESFIVTRALGKLIQLHHDLRPRPLEYLEAFTDVVFGKDLVFYARKPLS